MHCDSSAHHLLATAHWKPFPSELISATRESPCWSPFPHRIHHQVLLILQISLESTIFDQAPTWLVEVMAGAQAALLGPEAAATD